MKYRLTLRAVTGLALGALITGCVKGNPALPDPSLTITTISPFPTSGPTVIVPNP